MSRQRALHRELLESEDYQSLSLGAKALFIGLIAYADDHGRGGGSDRILIGHIFPGEPSARKSIGDWKAELAERSMARFYSDGLRTYFDLPSWSEWQKPKYLKDSKVPCFQEVTEIGPEPGPNPGQTRDKLARDLGQIGKKSPMGRVGSGLGRVGQGKNTVSSRNGRTLSVGFLKFWEAYPSRNGKKRGKPQAWKLWRDMKLEQHTEGILKAVRRDVAHRNAMNQRKEFCEAPCDPERYLKHKRWNDEIDPRSLT